MQETDKQDRDGAETHAGEQHPPSNSLPSRHLSPVLNPLLASHMGRWAEIYYTTPVEKRDEAVAQLLQELEAEARSGKPSPESMPAPKADAPALRADLPLDSEAGAIPSQEHKNLAAGTVSSSLPMERELAKHSEPGSSEPGSSELDLPDLDQPEPDLPELNFQNLNSKALDLGTHFESVAPEENTGTPLFEEREDSSAARTGVEAFVASSPEPTPVSMLSPIQRLPIPELEEAEIHADTAPEIGGMSASILATAAASEAPHPAQVDLPVAPFQTLFVPLATTRHRIPRSLMIASLFALGVVTLIWTLRHEAGTSNTALSSPTGTIAVPQAATPPAAETRTSEQEVPGETKPTAKSDPSLPSSTSQTPESAAENPAVEKSVIEKSVIEKSVPERAVTQRAVGERSAVENAVAEKSEAENQAPEVSDPDLQAGLQFLHGDPSGRNSAEAARYLWKSVSRQNGQALAELAGLYAKGDGVVKDCDQARILLQAAAHHKNVKLGATLETLHQSGCE